GYLIYFEGPGFNTASRTGTVRVLLQGTDGLPVPISRLRGQSETYSMTGHGGVAGASLPLARPGPHPLGAGPPSPPPPPHIPRPPPPPRLRRGGAAGGRPRAPGGPVPRPGLPPRAGRRGGPARPPPFAGPGLAARCWPAARLAGPACRPPGRIRQAPGRTPRPL